MFILKKISSLRLAVICLLLLMILVFWGTLYQVQHGLFAAQQRFYNSWVFFVLGAIPFPGTQTVLTVLFANLAASMISHFKYGPRQAGVVLVHAGILILLGGGFLTRLHAQESFLTLLEGEGSNVSSSWNDWEISLWRGEGSRREVTAMDADRLAPGRVLDFAADGVRLEVESYHVNARALQSASGAAPEDVVNPSGIHFLEGMPPEKEPVQNVPGGVFRLTAPGIPGRRVLLYGEDIRPHVLAPGDPQAHLALRRKRLPLPMVVRLEDFRREMHPNTDVARSFSSRIEVEKDAVRRKALIEMNEPFRDEGFTLYQASYALLDDGRESSTFAVVRNRGRLLPYVASVVTFLGLIGHFILQLCMKKENTTA